jgi:E3 ubiquitin-protein ligase TRIP12
MEKISAEYPGAIVREGGLAALLNFLPFFSTNVQRTAVTAAANCCRNISTEHFTMIRDAFPILRDVLTQADQRLVEQATLAVVRTLDSYRHNAEHLEGLLDLPTVVAINALLAPSGGSPLISDATYTHLIKVLTSSARASPKVTVAFLEAGITSTIHQILTGVLPSSHQEEEQGDAPGGQGLGSGIADMAIMQNLARRPKDQVEEILSLICELLPPLPRDGIFDPKGYTERSLAKIKKRGGRPERPKQRSSRSDGSGSSTPAETGTTPTGQSSFGNHVAKAKRDAEQLSEQRLALLKSSPELIGKFIRALVPVLVDVYAASVSLRVRTKSLTGLVKAAAFAEPVDLQLTLTVSRTYW